MPKVSQIIKIVKTTKTTTKIIKTKPKSAPKKKK